MEKTALVSERSESHHSRSARVVSKKTFLMHDLDLPREIDHRPKGPRYCRFCGQNILVGEHELCWRDRMVSSMRGKKVAKFLRSYKKGLRS